MLFIWPNVALAQRDAPVWNSFLPRINMFNERDTLDFEFTFKKGGGPHEQSHVVQSYILAYLADDEEKINKLAVNQSLTTKNTEAEKLLIEHLVEQELVVVLETKTAKKQNVGRPISPRSGRKVRGGYSYDFEFSFDNKDLFKKVTSLKNFNPDRYVKSDNKVYDDKFKLLVFVPVNDSRYATKIPEEQRESYDFAHFMDSKTILQYFKPLPYRFQFKPLSDSGDVLIYID